MLPLWISVLGVVQLTLFSFSFYVLIYKKQLAYSIPQIIKKITDQKYFLVLILGVVCFHLIEVNVIDPLVTAIMGNDYTYLIQTLEKGVVSGFQKYWTPSVLFFFVIIYIGIYPFTLWFSPFYYFISEKQQAMKTLAYGLIFIYFFSLPFTLFFPITNVYTTYDIPSSLSLVFPQINELFYSTTTCNNCFPSLHVAMTLLIARTAYLSGNKYYFYSCLLLAILVIISVMYLVIHWISDVIGGIILAGCVCLLVNTLMKKGYL